MPIAPRDGLSRARQGGIVKRDRRRFHARRRTAWLRRRVPPISKCAAISSTWWAARHRSKWAGTTI